MTPQALKGWIITGIFLWAIVFGVNIDGRHYGLSFSRAGVSVHFGE